MANINSKTPSNVVDIAKAREARIRHARPLQGRLLRSVAATMDPHTRAGFTRAVAEAVLNGTPTNELLRSIRRDQVRQAARAAL
jgi:hypothetical protein